MKRWDKLEAQADDAPKWDVVKYGHYVPGKQRLVCNNEPDYDRHEVGNMRNLRERVREWREKLWEIGSTRPRKKQAVQIED